jgi:hypothetical protein
VIGKTQEKHHGEDEQRNEDVCYRFSLTFCGFVDLKIMIDKTHQHAGEQNRTHAEEDGQRIIHEDYF